MKIVHCCFGIEHYIDTWGYQQNLLPLYHARLAHDTVVLASNDTFPSFVKPEIIETIKVKGNSYMNGPVRVIRSSSFCPKHIHFQKAEGLLKQLNTEKPDIIFFHGSQNLSLLTCVRYKKHHPEVSLFVDNHGDEFNVNQNRLYRFIFFKCFWGLIHKYCGKYVDKYFGVTKGRCDFLHKYFCIGKQKIELLPIGADVDSAKSILESKTNLRKKYGLNNDDKIIVHGGKLDPRKGTVDLITVYRQLKTTFPTAKLLLFGKMADERIVPMIDNDIIVFDWLSRTQTFELFKLADLAVWPIHHTTLIEDCVASGLPYLIRKTATTEHLINSDFYLNEGNCKDLFEKITLFLGGTIRNYIITSQKEILNSINYYNIAEKVINVHLLLHNKKKSLSSCC